MKQVLIIAGFDPTSGAGITADCLTAYGLGVHPMAVTTSVTVQNHSGVYHKEDLSEDLVFDQLERLLQDNLFDGIKIGMLGETLRLEKLAEKLEPLGLPLIWDPVIQATSGYALTSLDQDFKALLEMTSLLTPNLPEYQLLKNKLDRVPYLLKGGHAHDLARAIDTYYPKGHQSPKESLHTYESPRLKVKYHHGTGCALSTAITCYVILGYPMEKAISMAKDYLFEALAHPIVFKNGHGAIRR